MIRATCALITTDFYKEEKYILSTTEDSITLPFWDIEDYRNLQQNFKNIIVSNTFVDQVMANGYINPKFISINDNNISKMFDDSDKFLYFLYGCICPKLEIQSGFFWHSFDIYDTNLLTELTLINDVITQTI